MIDIPDSVRPLFVAAGWHPGRRMAPAPGVSVDHPAATILAEFDGLRVGKMGAGEECATSDLAFQQLPREDPVIDTWESLLSTRLVGIAEFHRAYGELHIDSVGRCFANSIVDDVFAFVGASFGEAVECLLLGRLFRPMLRPDQSAVRCFGQTFTAGDPRVYTYR